MQPTAPQPCQFEHMEEQEDVNGSFFSIGALEFEAERSFSPANEGLLPVVYSPQH